MYINALLQPSLITNSKYCLALNRMTTCTSIALSSAIVMTNCGPEYVRHSDRNQVGGQRAQMPRVPMSLLCSLAPNCTDNMAALMSMVGNALSLYTVYG